MQCKEYNIYLIDVLACLLYLSVEATLALAYALPWFCSIYFVEEMIREWARQLSLQEKQQYFDNKMSCIDGFY